MIRLGLNNEAEKNLSKSVYAIEANSFARQAIWEKMQARGIDVEHRGIGGVKTVGSVVIDGIEMPVAVEIWFGNYKGHTYAYFWGSSQVVDWRMVHKFIDDRGLKRTDEQNNHICFHHIDRMINDPQP